ncbi:hypothetical protein TNCV_592451 [Trichonephila clavipes]|nr:hypothetical protein TNCV_592451 [Trichonephila clavipes]
MRNFPFRRTQRPKSNKIIPCKTNSGPPAALTGEGIKLPCIFEVVRKIYRNIFGLASFEKVDRFRSEIQLAGHPVRGLNRRSDTMKSSYVQKCEVNRIIYEYIKFFQTTISPPICRLKSFTSSNPSIIISFNH